MRIRQGTEDEVAVVRSIFQQCLKRTSDEEIARELNRQAIPTWIGRPWNRGLVCRILRNENYIGNIVYNRQSHKLGTRKVSNSPDKWVRAERCIEPIVDPNVFQRVQRILQDRRIEIAEGEMLSRLRRTLLKRGRLSQAIINNTSGLPHVETFYLHFGSLRNAYSLIGYNSTERDWSYLDTKRAWADVRANFVREVAAGLEKLGRKIAMGPSDDQLRIDGEVDVSFRIARAQKAREGCLTQWRVYRPRRPDRWIIVIRLADDNQSVLDYLTIPTHTLTERHHASHFTFTTEACDRLAFDCFETAEALAQSLHRRTRTATKQIARRSRI